MGKLFIFFFEKRIEFENTCIFFQLHRWNHYMNSWSKKTERSRIWSLDLCLPLRNPRNRPPSRPPLVSVTVPIPPPSDAQRVNSPSAPLLNSPQPGPPRTGRATPHISHTGNPRGESTTLGRNRIPPASGIPWGLVWTTGTTGSRWSSPRCQTKVTLARLCDSK